MVDVKAIIPLLLSVTTLFAGQALPPTQERSVAAFQNRMASLNQRFKEVRENTQKKLDAADCRNAGRPEACRRLSDEMMTAMDAITVEIHREIDSFIRLVVGSSP